MGEPAQVQIPSGIVCVTTHGDIKQQTVQCLLEARSFSEKQGLNNAQWVMESATLVEKARNNACRNMLAAGAGWLLFVDADQTFAPDAVLRMLHTAYAELPHADVLGAWVPLRGDMAIPTIDTGTGTWESWFPGSGTLEVIRTGGAFLLIKRHVLEALVDPWFRMRVPARPIDFMLEVDNWARIKFDGRNPLRELPGEPWERLERCAKDDPSIAPGTFVPAEVGEDSGFCDRVRAAGLRIFVNTDIEIGHIDQRILSAADHRRALDDREKTQRLLCGITA